MPHPPVDPPSRRAVVLGASNVVRGIGHVVEGARAAWGGPLDLLMAAGYGRSYGLGSRVLGRALPSILDCGLWRALQERPALPTAALVTDVGNDILYGASVDDIATWVETCLARLRPLAERIVVTRLPLSGVDTLGTVRYLVVRTVLFPSSSVSLDEAREIALRVDERLVDLARRFDAHLVEPDPDWYGMDPIHVRRPRKAAAWRRILDPWTGGEELGRLRPSALRTLGLRRRRPERRTFLGFRQEQAQPVATLPDGSRLSLF